MWALHFGYLFQRQLEDSKKELAEDNEAIPSALNVIKWLLRGTQCRYEEGGVDCEGRWSNTGYALWRSINNAEITVTL